MRRQVVAFVALSIVAGGLALDGFGRVDAERSRPAGWVMTDLGPGLGLDINEAGVVLGFNFGRGPFLWSRGRKTVRAFDANAFNDRGDAVGSTRTGHCVLLRAGKQIDVGTLGGPTTFCGPRAINNRDDIAGAVIFRHGHNHAFVWRRGKMIELPSPGGVNRDSEATAINATGDIVGSVEVRPDVRHAVLWQHDKMIDLGTLGRPDWAWSSAATGINNRGEIVGYSYSRGGKHAFLWRNGTMRDIGKVAPFETVATAINDRGIVVGHTVIGFLDSTGGDPRAEKRYAIEWHNGRVFRLSPRESPSRDSIPVAINSDGQIVGHTAELGMYTDSRAVLWTPR